MVGRKYSTETLYQAFAPIRIANWVLGTSVFEYPSGRLRPGLTLIYYTMIFVFYGIMADLSMAQLLSFRPMHTSQMGIVLYKFLIIGNMGFGFSGVLLGWLRRKELNRCMSRLIAVEKSMTDMHIPKSYQKIFIAQSYQLVGLAMALVGMCVIDARWLFKRVQPDGYSLPMTIIFHYPVTTVFIADFTFMHILWYIEQRFRSLNKMLAGLARPNLGEKGPKKLFQKSMKNPATTLTTRVDANLSRATLRTVQESRDIHQELYRIARHVNTAYGMHLLLSMGCSSILVVGSLFTAYTTALDSPKLEVVLEAVTILCWTLLFSVKIVLVNQTCAKASTEAQRTGEIIFDLFDPTGGKEIQEEIQEFSLQLLQNPLYFTALGFFRLDYTFVQGMIGTVTTYLVILIQMSSISLQKSKTVNETKI